MAAEQQAISLTSRVLETKPAYWRDFQFIQQNNLKEITPAEMESLKASILSNQFTQPFYVWQEPGTGIIYCLDGKHRTNALLLLEQEGHNIPETLPATFIDCADKKEASRLVLIYSSLYAKITQQGLFDFLQLYDLGYADIKTQMHIPDFSTDRFEQRFDLFQTTDAEEPEVDDDGPMFVQPGDVFELNGHRIVCGSVTDAEAVKVLMNGKKARILNTDPPYNLPADFFLKDNKHTHNHADFDMGAGEMTDDEFVIFLATIMQAAVDNTVPGAIHYLFMDWRHVWHMTEAGRRVYGKVQPKQLCIWNKDLMANGSFYRAKHELCFVFTNEQARALWNKDLLDYGGFYKDNNELVFVFKNGDDDIKHLSHLDLKDRIRTNIWNYPSATSTANPDRYELKNHPTPKPVRMIADAILDTTNEKEIVIDFFLGSGTCLIACEQTNRLCYALDIKPKFIQSSIKRYLTFCHKKGTDVKFSHVNGQLTIKDFIHE